MTESNLLREQLGSHPTVKCEPDVSARVPVKLPTRIITYAWGDEYVEALLALTLPALMAADNLPFLATQTPCSVVVLTERRFFKVFDVHPVIAAIRVHCPVHLIKVDDLLVSSSSYGLSLTYILHRGFRDLGQSMTKHWQIFFNADFILANGSLRQLFAKLTAGWRIIAAPSYCTIAEEVATELRAYLDPTKTALTISHRDLARLVLRHQHKVIRGKTMNQTDFHMRYMDQFYWKVDEDALIGFQMPVAIVGLSPERYVSEPNTYWDYGLIREYCPTAEICVLGDSDEFTMLELRHRAVAADQVMNGPIDPMGLVARMVTWITPYQRDFLKFPLTLHAEDLPITIDEERSKLKSLIDDLMSHAPAFPSHIEHPQWQYHVRLFKKGRRTTLRAVRQTVSMMAKKMVKPVLRPIASLLLNRVLIPGLASRRLRIVSQDRIDALSAELSDLRNIANEYQFKLERSYDYQAIMAQDQIQQGLKHLDPEFVALYENCRQYTMTSWERLYALYRAIRYVVDNKIYGDIVECGVWRGGSMKLAAHVLLSLGVTDRNLFLYDTFEGMTKPDEEIDVDFSGNKAINDWQEIERRKVKWSYAPIDEVRETIRHTGYPMERIKFVKGPVEETIPTTMPEKIAILRLDTDWYASTKHEMEHLYPRLAPEGVLILDDYGHYQGAARAVDEYLTKLGRRPMLQRVDYSCRLAVKPVAEK